MVLGPSVTIVPKKLIQKIIRLEFIEMSDLLLDNANSDDNSEDKDSKWGRKKRHRITNILQWVECFNAYISIVATQHPTRVPDLLAYSSLIVHAACKFEGEEWTQYDRNFRKQVAGQPNRKWGDVDLSAWAMAFARATPREHCAICFSLDHTTKNCDEFEEPSVGSIKKQEPAASSKQGIPPICLKWNWNKCQSAECTYRHVCIECHGEHKAKLCSHLQGASKRTRYVPYNNNRPNYSKPQQKGNAFCGKRTDNQLEQLSDTQTTPDSCHFYINYNTNEQSIEDQEQIQDFIANTDIYLPIFMSIYAQNNHFTKIMLSTLHVGAYPHTADLLALNARGYNQLTPPAIEGLNHIQSPLVSKEWEKALQFHPDRAFVHYLLMCIQQGFRIGFDFTCRLSSSPKHMCSANDHPSVVADYLANELHAGRILGPIPRHLRDISSFGVIPKCHQVNKWRLVLDLSHPLQASVNAGIPKDLSSLQYASIDDAANIISELGQGTKLAKVDIAHVYRNIPVYPTDRLVLGMQWENNVFIDKVLPFGLRSTPKIFCAISDALEWILHTKGVLACLHYIDDFLTFGYPGSNQCDNLHILIQTCQELGLPLAVLKIEGPAAIIIFLGIELNTVLMTMRLPDEI